MSVLDRMIAERVVGETVPISIASALAIESALGCHPEIKVDSPPILEYKLLKVNVRTLIRNLLGSLTTDGKRAVTVRNIIPAIIEEMQIIESAISKASYGKAMVMFYISSYQGIKRAFPNALIKSPNTEIQKYQHALETAVVNGIKEVGVSNDLRFYDITIEGKFPDTLLLTHIAVDLLSQDKFSKCVLLESHTGAIKRHLTWNTKLTNGRELTRIPFNKFTLQVFGDGGVHFLPMPIKLKNEVKALAEKYKWSSITTRDKIVHGLSTVSDKTIRAQLQGLL